MISPQGYSLGEEPKAKNPFWEGSGEDSNVKRIYATATVDENVGTPSVQTTKSIDGNDITFGFNFHNLKGRDGTNGDDGVSPTITVTDITGGHRVSITDASGTHTFDVMNGTDGRDGRDGTNGTDGRDGTNGTDGRDGTDGISPSVSVSDITGGHRITVTDATGSETFDVMNGTNGQDGVSPTVSVTSIAGGHQVSITDAQGTDTFNVMDGTNGTDGRDGTDGQNGVSPTVSVTSITGGHQVSITDAQGTKSFNVIDGADGQNGVTPDITMTATADATASASPTVTVTKSGTTANPAFALAFSGLKGAPGADAEFPAGGSTGDILTKTADGVTWATPASGGGGMELLINISFGRDTPAGTQIGNTPLYYHQIMTETLPDSYYYGWDKWNEILTNRDRYNFECYVWSDSSNVSVGSAFVYISKKGTAITYTVYAIIPRSSIANLDGEIKAIKKV